MPPHYQQAANDRFGVLTHGEELQSERTFAIGENEFVTEREVFWNGFGSGMFAALMAVAIGSAGWLVLG